MPNFSSLKHNPQLDRPRHRHFAIITEQSIFARSQPLLADRDREPIAEMAE
jgi:hypothetical protein